MALSREKIPLNEQVEELGTEYLRRCRAYPLLVAAGKMRAVSAELKIERIASAHNTLCWLLGHADQIKEWMMFMKAVAPKDERAAIEFDAPMEVVDGQTEAQAHPDEDEASGGAVLPAAAE